MADLLDHARANSPFYARHYAGRTIRSVALSDIPPVTKTELMADFDGWVTDRRITRSGVEAFVADPALVGTSYLDGMFVCTSSGTTGHPGLFVHDRHAVAVYRALVMIRIVLAWLGPRQWYSFARRGLRWAMVVGTGGHFVGSGWVERDRLRGAWFRRAYRVFSVQQPLRDLVAELKAFDPTVLSGYPSALDLLAGEQAAGRLHLRPVFVETAGETTTAEVRTRLAENFGCPVFNAYGTSEFQPIASSCGEGWLHVNSDWAILEPVDADYRPTPPGDLSHTVLLTNLANFVQPIIRYDLGDSVQVRPDPCPCGCRLPAIRVEGRCDDVLRLTAADGHVVPLPPLAIGSVLDGVPGLVRGQLLQAGPSSIRLRLEADAATDIERFWRVATDTLQTYLGAQGLANVAVLRVDEPPEQSPRSGKFRQVIATPGAGGVQADRF